MARLRATFYFWLRGMAIERGLLGTSHMADYGEYSVELTFPKAEYLESDEDDQEIDPHIFPELDELPMMEGGGYVRSGASRLPSDWYARVRAVRARVQFDRTLSDEGLGSAEDALRETAQVAEVVVSNLVEWVRVESVQTWLGIGGAEVEHGGYATLEDLDAGHKLPVSLGWGRLVIQQIRPEQALHEDRLRELLGRSSLSLPPLPESLMADALFLASDAEPVDPTRAVLVSAIACELKVKEVLRSRAHPNASALLEWVLSTPRDHSVAAITLFDKGLDAVAGQSMRVHERDLYKGVQRLFELRNGIAHRGELPPEDEAQAATRAAFRAIRWLEQVGNRNSEA